VQPQPAETLLQFSDFSPLLQTDFFLREAVFWQVVGCTLLSVRACFFDYFIF
jgi:hypothetical protein